MSVQIKILAIGKLKKLYLQKGILDYCDRLKHYCKVEIVELKEPTKPSKTSDIQILRLESEKFVSKTHSKDFVISLDRKGEMLDSKGLPHLLQNCMNQNRNALTFVIGGEVGLDREI